ncbi:MAG: site-2 protease family protein, partial [Chloroflexota bacterium]|nr:site-2 protease family protein [Chloroflexota bacterium]
MSGEPNPRTGTGAAAPAYDTPRTPDAIYNADGTVALGRPRPFGAATKRRQGALGRLFAPLAGLGVLLVKLKFLLFALLKFKIFLTAGTMLISIVAYATLWGIGLPAAIGFVVLLLIHEMGHWVVMRLKGVPASAPIFIPFLGAVIGMRGMPRSVKDEAEIGIAGPIAGTAGALACVGLGNLYGGHLWPLLGVMGLFLNLFNLLPVSPLDGGRIVAAVSRWLWIVGLIGLVALFVVWHNPFLLLIGVIGGAE